MTLILESKYVTQFLESIIKNKDCGNIGILRTKFIYFIAS